MIGMEDTELAPISTGNAHTDMYMSALRHSGGAFWLVAGLYVADKSMRWANGTEIAHMAKAPIKKAGAQALNSAFNALKSNTWVIGPGLLAAAALFKQRATDDPEAKLSSQAEDMLSKTANSADGNISVSETGEVNVNASDILAIAKILQKECNSSRPLSSALTAKEIEKLLSEEDLISDLRWNVKMDVDQAEIDAGLISKNGHRFCQKLEELLKTEGVSETTLKVAHALYSLQYHATDVYNDQAEVKDYITLISHREIPSKTDDDPSLDDLAISSSFMKNFENVLQVTLEPDLVKRALADPRALELIESGHIRTELKLRDLFKTTKNKSMAM